MNDLDRYHALALEDVERAICEREPNHFIDHNDWAHDCHSVSLAIVRSDLFESARVARGSCRGVGGQHSWVVLGDPYDEDAPILDCTLWSYDDRHPVVWKGTMHDGLHRPHGWGHIMEWGCPESGGGEEIELVWPTPPSSMAKFWVDQMFRNEARTLDRQFWMTLASSAPVGGWPAGEIIAAMVNTPGLAPLVPIDRVGMLTDLNPDGLYLKGDG